MKKAFVDDARLREIIREYPTPFHIYDEKGIRENARKLRDAFAWNPGFREYFAVKATPTPAILRILGEEGCGLDCSSYTELMLADALGFHGDALMFSSNVTPAEEYEYCERLGGIVNLDDISHIEFLEKTVGLPERVCCRYNPGGKFIVANRIMDDPGDAKYGFTRQQLSEGFRLLRDKGVKEFGLHAFLVSNANNNEYYPQLAEMLFTVARELHEELGVHIDFVNLSGGIGVPYEPGEEAADIAMIGEYVRQAYDRVFGPAGMTDVKVFTELGRFMLAPFGQLVTTALHQKHIYKDYVGVDACAVNLMRPAMYGAYHHITVSGKESAPADHLYDVTGSLCENNDKFAIDRHLPEIEDGDILVIHDTGAHGFSMGYNYNGKLRSAELLLQGDGKVSMIRRAETPLDYFATFDSVEPQVMAKFREIEGEERHAH